MRGQAQVKWGAMVPSGEWTTYCEAIHALRRHGVRFMLGGGFAQAVFTGRLRDTKDMDFYIDPGAREIAKQAVGAAGFTDLYDRLPYARHWIYRSQKAGVIVDLIWSMANQRAAVDHLWFNRSGSVRLRGESLEVIPMEEFMWCKLYILQRDHCDWTDLFNVLYTCGRRVDWLHLIRRLEDDLPLLKGVLLVYAWLCPRRARDLPAELWRKLKIPKPRFRPAPDSRDRVRLLDSRCWFSGSRKVGEKLDV